MKKLIFLAIFLLLPVTTHAAVLECPTGQILESVMTDPGSPGIGAITHVIHHPPVTHTVTIIDIPAHTDCIHVNHGGDYSDSNCEHHHEGGNFSKVTTPAITHQVTVIDTPAYDEMVIDSPGTDAIPPTFENQCVPDASYIPPTPEAPKPIVSSGNGNPALIGLISDGYGGWVGHGIQHSLTGNFGNFCDKNCQIINLYTQLIQILNKML